MIVLAFGLICCLSAVADEPQVEQVPADNLILITFDGLRWQELFRGADLKLMNKDAGGVRDAKSLKDRFWNSDLEKRRISLMPFFWKEIAEKGQIIGDPQLEASAKCTNPLLFSYPGYNEILTGRADPRISSNAKQFNSNHTVLEWINKQPNFKGRLAAFCSWDVFPFIINDQRSGVYVNAGWQPLTIGDKSKLQRLNDQARQIPRVWPNVRYDLFTFEGAVEYIKTKKPRVIYIAFGETDDWAHDGRYDLYLDSAHRTDAYLQKIWTLVQSIPQYQNKTAMLITTDHGRGDGREGWKSHGVAYRGSDRIWYAAMGRGISARGNRKSAQVTQAQFAATAASLLGLKFDAEAAAPPINLGQLK